MNVSKIIINLMILFKSKIHKFVNLKIKNNIYNRQFNNNKIFIKKKIIY